MNEFMKLDVTRPLRSVLASTRQRQENETWPAIEGRAVEGAKGQARLGFPARGRRGRPAMTQGGTRRGLRGRQR